MDGETTAVQKSPINMDMTKGVLPANYAEVMQMAALVHNSGLAPKSLDTPQKVAVAMMMAMEIGLPVITGIQHIAVINGKAGIWGDATIALTRASGLMETGYPRETESGTPFQDNWTFTCTIKRKGCPEKVGVFTWAEARRAGLDNPQLRGGGKDIYSPWTRFPKRMMQWKARQWVYRDEFGDVLRGMKMAEELYDYIDMEPKGNGKAWEPEPSVPGFDYDIFRQGLIQGNGFLPEDIDAFEAKLAAHYKKPIAEIRQQIGDNPDSFFASLTKWAQTNGTPHPPVQAEEPPPPDTEENTDETIDPGTEDEGPKDPIRDEFINLRTQGYSTWVHKNKARIPTFSQDIQDEIRQKWLKMYPSATFPLDKEAAPITNGNGNGATVFCPQTNTRKYVKVCQECDKAEKCQSYQEWVFENGTTPQN